MELRAVRSRHGAARAPRRATQADLEVSRAPIPTASSCSHASRRGHDLLEEAEHVWLRPAARARKRVNRRSQGRLL
eukprot:scaffold14792_cov146-Isochrysis_galbana.AAC.3